MWRDPRTLTLTLTVNPNPDPEPNRNQVPCGEIPGPLYAELDDISNKWGHGDLRATTRQAFQLHGVMKSNLKEVIKAIANIGSNTYGGCGDIRSPEPSPSPSR